MSMFYYIAFILFQVLGIYFLVLNNKNKNNRFIFGIFASLAIWAISLSALTFSENAAEAAVWFRVSGIGWCVLYVLLPQYILHYTWNKHYRILKYAVFLVPVLLFFFGYYSNPEQMVVWTKFGFTSKASVDGNVYSLWDFFIQVYFLFLHLYLIYLLYRYEKSSSAQRVISQTRSLKAGLILYFLISILLVSIRSFWGVGIPELTVFSAFAISFSLLYNHRHYNFLCMEVELTTKRTRILEPEINRGIGIANLYIILSNILYFVVYYYYRVSNNWIILLSMFLIPTALYLLYLSDISERKKGIFASAMIVFSIMVSTILMDGVGALTTWAYGFSVLLMLVTSNSSRKIWVVASSIFLVQLFIIFRRYGTYVYYTNGDYLLRTFFAFAMMYVALFIRRLISAEDTHNKNHLRFQEIITELSEEGIESVDERANNLIKDILNVTSVFFDVERGTILVKDRDDSFKSIFSWSRDGHDYSLVIQPDLYERISADEFVYVRDIRSLSIEDEHILRSTFGNNITSVLIIPIYKEDELIAMLCCESAQRMKFVITDIINTLSNTMTSMFEKAEKENTILTYAYYDTYTGLPNRNMFTKKLEEELNHIRKLKASGEVFENQLAVVFIGFEFHKRLSGSTGQDISEQHLAVIGKRITAIGEGKHLLARFGNDNLIMLLRDYGSLDRVIEKINAEVREPIVVDGNVITVSLMIGAAVYPEDGDSVRSLVKNSDMALYEARRRGSSAFVRYTSDLASKFEEKIVLTNSLYRAVENNELALFYQPQISAQTQKIVGVEALIRWFHPDKGMISPGLFIPIAEETGIITSIGKWVLEQSCAQAREWNRKFGIDVLMAVNVSTRQLQDGALSKIVESVLRKNNMDAKALEIEVTESEQMTTQNQAIDNLLRLKELGVQIAIDDFGTKHSSLARLRHLPITKLKIDMNFVRAIDESENSNSLVKSIIRLGKNLNLKVLAEGVETVKQFEFLREHGCDEIQGYYFYKPLRKEEIEFLLSRQAESEAEKING